MTTYFNFEEFQIDSRNRDLLRRGIIVPLRPKAFAVLLYMIEASHRLVSKDELLDAIWSDVFVSEAALQVCIVEIRKVLGDNSNTPRFIETLHKKGYRFIAHCHRIDSETEPVMHDGIENYPIPIGRKTTIDRLYSAYRDAIGGDRQIVFVTGDPGIGKTTVINAFVNVIQRFEHAYVCCGQCVDHCGPAEAYLPVLDAIESLCNDQSHESVLDVLFQYAPTWLLQMPGLIDPTRYQQLQHEIGEVSRKRMLREIAEAIEAIAEIRPMVLVLEDLHWSDNSTVDLIDFLRHRAHPAKIMIICSYRPVEIIVTKHPLKELAHRLLAKGLSIQLCLEYLNAEQTAAYIDQHFPGICVESNIADVIYRKTDGNPLFIDSLLTHLKMQGILNHTQRGWHIVDDLNSIQPPDDVREMITQQLHNLEAIQQELLKAASVVGRRVTTTELSAICDIPPAEIEEHCDRIAQLGCFLRFSHLDDTVDGTISACYEFTHVLYQNVLYDELSPIRRTRLHRQTGQYMEKVYCGSLSELSVKLAEHFTLARDYHRAIEYWKMAANRAIERHTYRESRQYIEHGLQLLQHIPDRLQRKSMELGLTMTLGPILIATEGNASKSVEQAYQRAQEICIALEDKQRLFPVLFGLRSFYLFTDHSQVAHDYSNKLLDLAQEIGDEDFLLEAYVALSSTHLLTGRLSTSGDFAKLGIELYDINRHAKHASLYGTDPGVFCRSRYAQVSWLLGYPDRALTEMDEAVKLGRHLSHPYSLVFAIHNATQLHLYRLDSERALVSVDEGKSLAKKFGFSFLSCLALHLRAWALAMSGDRDQALAELEAASAAEAPKSRVIQGFLKIYLAEAYSELQLPQQGLALLDHLAAYDNPYIYPGLGEQYRLRGEFLLMQSDYERAQEYLLKSIEVNSETGHLSYQLRAALSLARFWTSRGRHFEAKALISETCEQLPERSNCHEWIEARKFVDKF